MARLLPRSEEAVGLTLPSYAQFSPPTALPPWWLERVAGHEMADVHANYR